MINVPITFDEAYQFIKLYDILRDMDFPLTSKQQSVFEKITKAKELLPTDIEGCFFGSEEYDDWYFENLEDTKKVLDKLFAYEETAEDGHHFDNFYYQSSW